MPESPASAHIPLASQVGGHPGILTTEDGSLLIKPALATEVHFYRYVEAVQEFAPLRPFLPCCYGTLRLEGQVDPTADALGPDGATLRPVEGVPDAEKDEYDYVYADLEESDLRMDSTEHSARKYITSIQVPQYPRY